MNWLFATLIYIIIFIIFAAIGLALLGLQVWVIVQVLEWMGVLPL